jgi:hypothetical protein
VCLEIKHFEEYLKTKRGVTGWTAGQIVNVKDIFGTYVT